jgi:hypothetical protein
LDANIYLYLYIRNNTEVNGQFYLLTEILRLSTMNIPMKKLLSPLVLILLVSVLLSSSVLLRSSNVYAATAAHVVISEVLPGITGSSTNEFIELYNPTNTNIDVTGWRLSKKSASASATEMDLVGDFPAKTINAHGYLLIAHTDYDGTVVAEDITYSANSFAASNTILLYDSADVLVDKVGMGSANDKEGTAKSNPSSPASIERKATSTSLASTMAVGGTEETAGNGEDTDNNSSDFVNRGVPQPQNGTSVTEPSVVGTGTPTPTATPTVSVTATPTGSLSPTTTGTVTVTPTGTSTGTPTVTLTNSPTPTATLTPTSTNTPTLTPTVTSSPTSTVTPTLTLTFTPTVSPTLTPTPVPHTGPIVLGTFQVRNKTVVCTLDVKVKKNRHWYTKYIPVIRCEEV